MSSSKPGKSTSASVENITPFGIWLLVKGVEYFLNYEPYPYFKDQTLRAVQNVKLLHGFHLYWPDLDVDREIDNLENPEKYPLQSKSSKKGRTASKRARPASHKSRIEYRGVYEY